MRFLSFQKKYNFVHLLVTYVVLMINKFTKHVYFDKIVIDPMICSFNSGNFFVSVLFVFKYVIRRNKIIICNYVIILFRQS